MSPVEEELRLLRMTLANIHRDLEKYPEPLDVGWPWPPLDELPPEEQERLEKSLERRSVFRDR